MDTTGPRNYCVLIRDTSSFQRLICIHYSILSETVLLREVSFFQRCSTNVPCTLFSLAATVFKKLMDQSLSGLESPSSMSSRKKKKKQQVFQQPATSQQQKMTSSKQHAAASTSTSLRSWDAKDTEKFSGCNVVQYACTYVIMYAVLYKSCTYVHVRTYVDVYCPYDITIEKFIYTGCVTIVMLHGPSGN